MLVAVWWGGLAAASLLIGYVLANRGLSNQTIGMIMGLGAGALVSANAYELVPESTLGSGGMLVAFALGALVFFGGDWVCPGPFHVGAVGAGRAGEDFVVEIGFARVAHICTYPEFTSFTLPVTGRSRHVQLPSE